MKKQNRGITIVFIIIFGFIVFNSLFLYIMLNFMLSHSLLEADSVVLNVLFSINFIILIILITFAYYKALKPLNISEKKVFEIYDEIIQSKSSPCVNRVVGLDEIIETVITQQRNSWHRELTANLLRQKAELAQLQSQINPHFLYNTLDSIRGLALMKKVPEIAKMTEALSLLFRNNTRKIGMLVPLADEIKCIENYILIQQFRFANKFVFEKHISTDGNDILQCMIPSFIIQPIIENAIYHGLETVPTKGKIALYAYHTQSRLVIQVNDNGCGIAHNKLDTLNREINHNSAYNPSEIIDDVQTGIGLVNINQRIKLQFGDQYGITIASTVDIGTQVEITLPYTP